MRVQNFLKICRVLAPQPELRVIKKHIFKKSQEKIVDFEDELLNIICFQSSDPIYEKIGRACVKSKRDRIRLPI